MNDEERRKRIAEAAYYRAQGRGFSGDRQLDDWLAAERELALLTSAEPESGSEDPEDPRPPQPDQTSGAAIPAPLAKEDRIRAEEVKQSARELSEATEAQKEAKSSANPAPTQKKPRKRASDGKTAELRRSV